jgi:hypothetical protein
MDQFLRIKEANRLFRNNGDGTFTDKAKDWAEPVNTGWGWNGLFFDFDNDGHPDIHVANGLMEFSLFYNDEKNVLMHFDPREKKFRDVSKGSGVDFPGNSRGGAAADFDGDGAVDLLMAGFHPPRLFRNSLKDNGNHWLELKLEGKASNRDAVGARVQVTAGDLVQNDWIGGQGGGFYSQAPKELHFGLGPRGQADAVEIWWPSGRRQKLAAVKADQKLVVQEP